MEQETDEQRHMSMGYLVTAASAAVVYFIDTIIPR